MAEEEVAFELDLRLQVPEEEFCITANSRFFSFCPLFLWRAWTIVLNRKAARPMSPSHPTKKGSHLNEHSPPRRSLTYLPLLPHHHHLLPAYYFGECTKGKARSAQHAQREP